MKYQIKLLNELARKYYADQNGAVTWAPSTPRSAGYDLYFCGDKPLELAPNSTEFLPTGIALCSFSDYTAAGLVLPRSGLGAKHGIVLGNLVGLIDTDYQNQWIVAAWNRSLVPFTINPGDRIAQCIFVPVVHPVFDLVAEFSEETARGQGGFGSTGQGTETPEQAHTRISCIHPPGLTECNRCGMVSEDQGD